MSGTNATVSRKKGTSALVRPRFEPGMLLQHDDLEQMSSYAQELNRLMFRSLFGCGVVCGLVVRTAPDECGRASVVIGAGLALDGCGDPIHVPKDERLLIDDECNPSLPSPLWVLLCKYSKRCSPRTAMCASDEEETSSVCARERAGYEIRIVRTLPRCICSCDEPTLEQAPASAEEKQRAFTSECWCVDPELPCYRDHYAGRCECSCGDCAAGSCGCDCVVLATLNYDRVKAVWTVDHRSRRFVRPVLMRDPQVECEERARRSLKKSDESTQVMATTVVAEKKLKAAKSAKAPSVDLGPNA
jgi:hypothetical protein